MTQIADVVVIGGGIIGCACAYFLARDGHRVVLLERGEIGSGAASASGGWVIVQDKETPEDVCRAVASRKLYDQLAADVNIQLVATGGLILATNDSDRRLLHRQAGVARSGGAVVDELDSSTLHELEPALSSDLPGALHCAQEAVVDPLEVCRALARRAAEHGTAVHIGTPATGIKVDRGHVSSVLTSGSTIATRNVICTAGAWSPQIGAMIGLDIPVSPRRGHLIVTDGPSLIGRPMLEAGYLATPDEIERDDQYRPRFVMQPRLDGRCLIGSSREFAGFAPQVNDDLVRRMHAHAVRFVPAVARAHIAQVTVGFRPYAAGGRPLIGRAGPEGFVTATGHEGEGVTLAPVTGKLVSDMIAGRIDRTGFEMQAPASVQ